MVRFPAVLACLAVLTVSASAQPTGDVERGRSIADRLCAECHAINVGEPSPRLESPAFDKIAATPGMTELAIKVWLQTPHPTMPNLMLPTDDREDVAAYIASLKK
ncbi:MAG: cytochrome c [Hyphomicrobiaceae bacterium]